MFTKINAKIRKFLQFFIEKPSAQGDWRWAREHSTAWDSEVKKSGSLDDSSDIYIPYQLNYFFNASKSSNSSDQQTEKTNQLIHLSNCLAKAYYPSAPEISNTHQE